VGQKPERAICVGALRSPALPPAAKRLIRRGRLRHRRVTPPLQVLWQDAGQEPCFFHDRTDLARGSLSRWAESLPKCTATPSGAPRCPSAWVSADRNRHHRTSSPCRRLTRSRIAASASPRQLRRGWRRSERTRNQRPPILGITIIITGVTINPPKVDIQPAMSATPFSAHPSPPTPRPDFPDSRCSFRVRPCLPAAPKTPGAALELRARLLWSSELAPPFANLAPAGRVSRA